MGLMGSKTNSKTESSGSDSDTDKLKRYTPKLGSIPLVYSRWGSMYFDEDGDLAHEFYVEVLPKKRGGSRRMRKISQKKLVPEGKVDYNVPCLSTEFPIIMYQG